MELDILTAALRLRDRGMAVFPVDITTKRPLIEWGGLDAVKPSKEQVKQWFGGAPRAVGIACGPVSNIILLDFDFKKHPEAKEFYEKNRHRIPRTWKEETGSGGLHFYFRWVEALNSKQTNTTSKLHIGVDTKGWGGYSKISPSPGYKWIIPPHLAPLAMCPKWLVDSLPSKDKLEIASSRKIRPQDWILVELNAIEPKHPTKGCTPTFTRVIGSLKARRLSEGEIRAFLMHWVVKHDYTSRIDKLIDDQFHRYPLKVETVNEDLKNHSLKSFMSNRKPIPFLVPGFFGVKTINVIAGLQESRKSWLLLDLAVALASGTPWFGKYPCVRSKVLVIDQERPREEMQRRIDALVQGRGLTLDELEGNLVPKADIQPKFNLAHQWSFDLFEQMIAEVQPNVLLIDSLKAIQSGDIKDSNAMQPLFEHFKMIRTKYGVTIVILHHENNRAFEMIREKRTVTEETIEGSASIKQVPEGLFVARKFDSESTTLHHVKNSYGTKSAPLLVKVNDLTPDRRKIAVQAF